MGQIANNLKRQLMGKYLISVNLKMQYEQTMDARATYGYSIEDMLVSCIFNGNECTSDDFETFTDEFYNLCYVFNADKNSSGHSLRLKQVSKEGHFNGLKMVSFNMKLRRGVF